MKTHLFFSCGAALIALLLSLLFLGLPEGDTIAPVPAAVRSVSAESGNPKIQRTSLETAEVAPLAVPPAVSAVTASAMAPNAEPSPEQQRAFRQLGRILAGEKNRNVLGQLDEGFAAWESLAEAPHYVPEDFAFQQSPDGNWTAENPAQGFLADFTEIEKEGVRFRSLLTEGGFSMATPGRPAGEISVNGDRMEIDRGEGLTEWYVTGESGVEHGFTVAGPLASDHAGELSVEVAFDSELEPVVEDGARIEFRDPEGKTVFSYDKLKVFDAEGKRLEASIEARRSNDQGAVTVALVVAAENAAWPVTIDPLVSSEVARFDWPDKSSAYRGGAVPYGGNFYFPADDGVHGAELWKSDGTAGGTMLVEDIWPGQNSGLSLYSFPAKVFGGVLLFSANDGASGKELWRSDGTANGTFRLKDIQPGSESSDPEFQSEVGGKLCFTALDDDHGTELWVTDGTGNGTVLLMDIYPGTTSSEPEYFTAMGGDLFFSADDGSAGEELWKTDGTPGGTELVRDINSGLPGSGPRYFVAFGNLLLFSAVSDSDGRELWKSDGSAGGTVMVKDIRSGRFSSSPSSLLEAAGMIFFQADDGAVGKELWKTDGTPGGTILVKDINGSGSSSPSFLFPFANKLFFRANDGTTGNEYWVSDGTGPGTLLLKDINPGSGSGANRPRIPVDLGKLVFAANDGTSGDEPWVTNGTPGGTILLKNAGAGDADGVGYQSGFTMIGGLVYFSSEGETPAIWKTDGTPGGTVVVKNGLGGSSFLPFGGKVYFTANDGENGSELFRTDGTAAGTFMVAEINRTTTSYTNHLAELNDELFFTADDGVHGSELWKSDGTAAGTVLLKDIYAGIEPGDPRYFTVLGNALFFAAKDPVRGRELWKTDGTGPGTEVVKDINPGSDGSVSSVFAVLGGSLFFSANDGTTGSELWKSDGTAGGTELVKDINTGPQGSGPRDLTRAGSLLFFSAWDPACGNELWKTDGTSVGTEIVKDLYPGTVSGYSVFGGIVEFNGEVFFRGVDANGSGYEFWKSDGTPGGTVMVKDLNVGATSGDPGGFVVAANAIYFYGTDGISGAELWRSNGTESGTRMVKDINPGGANSYPNGFVSAGNIVFFLATDEVSGRELWKTDATEAGTVQVKDIAGGGADGVSTGLTAFGNSVYFGGNSNTGGSELWKSDGTAAGTISENWAPGLAGVDPLGLALAGDSFYYLGTDAANDQVMLRRIVGERQVDMMSGKSLGKVAGNNVYNTSGAGQTVSVRKKRKANFFFRAQNDGDFSDDLRVRATKGNRKIKIVYFRLTGGRANVTGAIIRSGYVHPDVEPGEAISFQGQAKAKFKKGKGGRTAATSGKAANGAGPGDLSKTKLKLKK